MMAEVVTENTGDSNIDTADTLASEIPFYPDYRYERSLDNTLNVYWFEKDFCQHNYGQYAHRNSNACTIIVLLMAAKCAEKIDLQIIGQSRCCPSHDLIVTFAKAIIEENELYFRMIEKKSFNEYHLNIPEAMNLCGTKVNHIREWKSIIYSDNMKQNLFIILKDIKHQWYHKSQMLDKTFLFVVLIAEGRSILLIYSNSPSTNNLPPISHNSSTDSTITLIDSHSHTMNGSLVVQCDEADVFSLSLWIYNKLFRQIYLTNPTCFELSLFEIKN
ncbi:unnamed protein product [Diamesa tonsa]